MMECEELDLQVALWVFHRVKMKSLKQGKEQVDANNVLLPALALLAAKPASPYWPRAL